VKFLLVTELFAPSVGGVQARFMAWAKELLHQGHAVEVWCIGDVPGLAAEELIDGVPVRRIVQHDEYRAGGFGKRHVPTVLRFCFALWSARRSVAEFDAVVFGKWPFLHALLVPYPRGPRMLFDWCELRSGRIWSLLYGALLRRRIGHIAIHAGIRDWLTQESVPSSEVTVIGSATEAPGGFVPPARIDRRIAFVGRLNGHKQPLLLLQAFRQAKLGDSGYTLHIAGSGQDAAAIEALAQGTPGAVFVGAVDDAQKFALLASAALMVLPSVREGFPVVLAEACAVGTPTLTIDAPDNGTAYVVRQLKCGWVEPTDAAAIGEAMRRYACIDTADWESCASNASLRSADTLSIQAQVRALVDAATRRA
jgi:glycosyltransferase involved in cell wall biosynthesis